MEAWQKEAGRSPRHRHRDHPSFSSTLLDAIYRSIDEAEDRPVPSRPKPPDFGRRIRPATEPELTRRAAHPRKAETSSSSDASSYGGFSSSEAESVPARLRSIRTGPAQPPPAEEPKRAKKGSSIRSRLLRELKKGRAPASPGARLASFLNSLFASKSPKPADDSACSRSCLMKTPSSRGKPGSEKRTVRFCPVGPIADRPVLPDEEEEEESDSSSDLFELENLAVIGEFRDELPVYETTRPANFPGISRGFVV